MKLAVPHANPNKMAVPHANPNKMAATHANPTPEMTMPRRNKDWVISLLTLG
jgi:hypothetical protein